MDIFVEQLVKKQRTTRDNLITILIIAAVFIIPLGFFALGAIVNFYFGFIAFASLIACIYGAWYLISSQNLEYEYSITNNNLTIDKVIAKRKRKKLTSVDVKSIERLEKFKGSDLDNKPFDKVFNAQGVENSDDVYAATYYTEKFGKCILLFSPEDKILNAMKPFLKKDIVLKLFYKR